MTCHVREASLSTHRATDESPDIVVPDACGQDGSGCILKNWTPVTLSSNPVGVEIV